MIETINLLISKLDKTNDVIVQSLTNNIVLNQKKSYIFDENLPYWVIYRDDFFDKVAENLSFGVFDVFRDRQLTNSNTSLEKKIMMIFVSSNLVILII